MKKTMLLLAFLWLSAISVLQAQYTVTKVSGRVKTGVGAYVRPGSTLNATDLLIFSSHKDKIWVIVPGKGEKVLTPSPQAQVLPNGLSQLLSDASLENVEGVSLRAGVNIIENIPGAITSEDERKGKIIIEQENKYLFDVSQYPQTGRSTFFLQITAMSKAPVTHRLKVVGDTLVIYYKDFLSPIDDPTRRYELGYYNENSPASKRICVINPYFDLINEMEDIIANTVNTYKGEKMSEDSLKMKAYNNIYSFTGKPNGILFSTLFEKYWSGSIEDTIPFEKRGKGNNFEESDFINVPVLSSSATASRDALPNIMSLRQYAPPVGNQGAYNTCSAWASAYATRTIAFAVSHNYTINNDYDKIVSNSFSPDFVYNNVQPSGDCTDFSSLKKSLSFIVDKGALLKKSSNFACGVAYVNGDFDAAKTYRIKDFQRINDPATDSEITLVSKIKTLLVNKNAIAFGMVTPGSFDDVKKSGIWLPTDDEYKNIDSVRRKLLKRHDGHAMCVIGYNDDISGGSFEIMNSWGPLNGNNGFYWINYHDFFLFAYEMYTVSDFGSGTTNIITNSVKADSLPKSIPVAQNLPTPKQETVAVKIEDTKPRLKGEMQLMLYKQDQSYEGIQVNASPVTSNGDNAAAGAFSYASFNLAKPLYSGNKYQIKFSLSQSAYVYVLDKDDQNNYSRLFPQKDLNESPLINFTNATLYLPSESQNYKLDNVPGKEKMCVLLSKSPIDIKTLDDQIAIANNNIYQTVRQSLANRLLEMKNVKFSTDNRINFDSEVTDDNVLAFFIEMTHL